MSNGTALIRLKQRRASLINTGWEIASSALGIGIPHNLVNVISSRTTTTTIIDGVEWDTRNLVVIQNVVGGIGRYASQYIDRNCCIIPKKYWLPDTGP